MGAANGKYVTPRTTEEQPTDQCCCRLYLLPLQQLATPDPNPNCFLRLSYRIYLLHEHAQLLRARVRLEVG